LILFDKKSIFKDMLDIESILKVAHYNAVYGEHEGTHGTRREPATTNCIFLPQNKNEGTIFVGKPIQGANPEQVTPKPSIILPSGK
jgi:hypothetical protein